jgi:hypothetical protein
MLRTGEEQRVAFYCRAPVIAGSRLKNNKDYRDNSTCESVKIERDSLSFVVNQC